MRIPSKSNPTPAGVPQGTMGGQSPMAAGSRPGLRSLNMGGEIYLWILVLIEVLLVGYARQALRRHHGG